MIGSLERCEIIVIHNNDFDDNVSSAKIGEETFYIDHFPPSANQLIFEIPEPVTLRKSVFSLKEIPSYKQYVENYTYNIGRQYGYASFDLYSHHYRDEFYYIFSSNASFTFLVKTITNQNSYMDSTTMNFKVIGCVKDVCRLFDKGKLEYRHFYEYKIYLITQEKKVSDFYAPYKLLL